MTLVVQKERKICKTSTIDRDLLDSRGWVSLLAPFSSIEELSQQMLSLAAKLGIATPTRNGTSLIDSLHPIEAATARPRSLSKLFATGEFPLHVDTAHWLRPCHFIILACVSPGGSDRPTFLMDTRSLPLNEGELSLLHHTPLRIRNGRNSFFSTILSKERPFVRYDPGCMEPTTADGAKALAVLARENWPEHVQAVPWEPGTLLVIDNWRILHGRGCAACDDFDRQLLRVSIQ